jgi:hypothetical protein
MQYRDGNIVITHTPEQQKKVEQLLDDLRSARGPRVERGTNIAVQRAKGLVAPQAGLNAFAMNEEANNNDQVTQFLNGNYYWRWSAKMGVPDEREVQEIVAKLDTNLGQKVLVSSINVNADARGAASLGVSFRDGNNDVRYAVVDEAQLRTLMELDARNAMAGLFVPRNGRSQETIIGTDALIANGWVANESFAGDRFNRLNVNENLIDLPHEKYVLIDNGRFLTAVRAGQMQHWTEPAAWFQFAEAPQDIDCVRAGRMVKFEKTLVKPTDELFIGAEYSWKGGAR